jgi:lipopolysaccharide transport system permease protein
MLLAYDVAQSLRNWQFWSYLGWNDIAKQYRRSFIGPVWITLNTAIFIVAFGLVGAQLFKLPIEDYLPFFCAGQILFTFLSTLINEGCQTFISADAFLKQSAYPKFAFVLRVVWRNLILLGHNLVVVVVVLLWFGGLGKVNWLAFLAALLVTDRKSTRLNSSHNPASRMPSSA